MDLRRASGVRLGLGLDFSEGDYNLSAHTYNTIVLAAGLLASCPRLYVPAVLCAYNAPPSQRPSMPPNEPSPALPPSDEVH